MRTSNQAASIARPRPKGRGKSKLLLMSVLIALFIYVGVNALLAVRMIPIGMVTDVPVVTRLHPVVETYKNELLTQSEKAGVPIRITSDFRSSHQQDSLYRQGRETEGAVVTYSKGGESYHNYGLAIDFVLLLPKGQVTWDLEYDGNKNGESDWMEVVAIAKGLGFSWGGDWEGFRDYPHLQMDFGYSIRDLQWGWRPEEGQDLK